MKLGTLAPFRPPWEQLTRDWESRVQAHAELSGASSPSGGGSDSLADQAPRAPTPGRAARGSGGGGTAPHGSREPEGAMDTECPAQAGTEREPGQDARGPHFCVVR